MEEVGLVAVDDQQEGDDDAEEKPVEEEKKKTKVRFINCWLVVWSMVMYMYMYRCANTD